MLVQQSRKSGTDALGRYYTTNIVGRTLVCEMNLKKPEIIMDLGAGDGALTVEASKLWTTAKFVTVDIDNSVKHRGIIANNRHYTSDVLNSQLHTQIGIALESVDGAICNPPYIRPRWRKDFAEILEDAELSGIFPSIQDVGADVLFIAQNLRFLRPSGRLGLILPDGVLAGEKYTQLRKKLLTQHRIERVIELPRRIFKKTDAKAHIVILTKKEPTDEPIIVERMEVDGTLSARLHIPITTAIRRLDYSYLVSQQSQRSSGNYSLRDVCNVLSRGQLNSVNVRQSIINVFHSTDFPHIVNNFCPEVPKDFLLTKTKSTELRTVIASAGDILMCRVGRNLEKKICYVPKGYVALSDCVYKLKIKKEFRAEVVSFLCGNLGRYRLSALAHGVGAKHLSKDDLLNFTIEIN
jgi:type I restriction enzyme M protein